MIARGRHSRPRLFHLNPTSIRYRSRHTFLFFSRPSSTLLYLIAGTRNLAPTREVSPPSTETLPFIRRSLSQPVAAKRERSVELLLSYLPATRPPLPAHKPVRPMRLLGPIAGSFQKRRQTRAQWQRATRALPPYTRLEGSQGGVGEADIGACVGRYLPPTYLCTVFSNMAVRWLPPGITVASVWQDHASPTSLPSSRPWSTVSSEMGRSLRFARSCQSFEEPFRYRDLLLDRKAQNR